MKRIINRILTKWYYFIVSLIVISVSFSCLTNILATPKRNESVTVFIASNGIQSSLEDKLNENIPEYLEHIFINYKPYNDQYIGESFATSGVQLSDCFILPQDFLDPLEYESLCQEIDTTYMNQYFNYEFEYVYENNKAYGIKMYDKATNKGLLSNYITYTSTDYYLYFNLNSVQLGYLNNTNDGIFFLIEKIIGLSD